MEEEELYDMCKNILDLHRQRFIIIKNEIENINEHDYFYVGDLRTKYPLSKLQEYIARH